MVAEAGHGHVEWRSSSSDGAAVDGSVGLKRGKKQGCCYAVYGTQNSTSKLLRCYCVHCIQHHIPAMLLSSVAPHPCPVCSGRARRRCGTEQRCRTGSETETHRHPDLKPRDFISTFCYFVTLSKVSKTPHQSTPLLCSVAPHQCPECSGTAPRRCGTEPRCRTGSETVPPSGWTGAGCGLPRLPCSVDG